MEIVRFLLDFNQRRVDYNLESFTGLTPFNLACLNGRAKVVEALVADERIDVNKPDITDQSPLWFVSRQGLVDIAKLILASGRKINTAMRDSREHKTAVEIANDQGNGDEEDDEEFFENNKRRWSCLAIASLIESYEREPQKVRAKLREELFGQDS